MTQASEALSRSAKISCLVEKYKTQETNIQVVDRKETMLSCYTEKYYPFWSKGPRLCSLPTTRCDPFTSSTKPSHASSTPDPVTRSSPVPDSRSCTTTKEGSAVSLKIDKDCKSCLTRVLCVLQKKISKITGFQCNGCCKTFPGQKFGLRCDFAIDTRQVAV